MNCEEALAALSASLDGEASRDEVRAAMRHLDACASCRDEFAAMRAAEKLLSGERRRRANWTTGARSRRRARVWTLRVAAAALILLGVGLAILRPGGERGGLPKIAELRGEVALSGRAACLHERLAAGGRLETRGEGASAVLEYRDGTLVTVGGDSSALVSEDSVETPARGLRLERGVILARVARGGAGFRVQTGIGSAAVLGTVFEVRVGDEGRSMHLAVARGAVRLRGAGDEAVGHIVRAGLRAALRGTEGRITGPSSLEAADWKRLLGSVPEHARAGVATDQIPSGAWVRIGPSRGLPGPGARSYVRMVYSAAHGGGLLFGGQGAGRDNALWCFEAGRGAWRQVCPPKRVDDAKTAAVFPEPRDGHAIAALPDGDVLVVGGCGRFGPGVVWRHGKSGWSSAGRSRYWPLYAGNCWVPAAGRLFAFGHEGSMPRSGFCSLDPAGNTWQTYASDTMPRRRTRMDNYMCWDSKRGRVLLQRFPIEGDPEGTPAATWEFDPGNTKWTDLPESAKWTDLRPRAQPGNRGHGAMAYSAKADALLLYGGDALGGETWVYDCAANSWRQLHPDANPPPRTRHALYYDPSADLFVVYGGSGTGGYLGDTWVFRFPGSR